MLGRIGFRPTVLLMFVALSSSVCSCIHKDNRSRKGEPEQKQKPLDSKISSHERIYLLVNNAGSSLGVRGKISGQSSPQQSGPAQSPRPAPPNADTIIADQNGSAATQNQAGRQPTSDAQSAAELEPWSAAQQSEVEEDARTLGFESPEVVLVAPDALDEVPNQGFITVRRRGKQFGQVTDNFMQFGQSLCMKERATRDSTFYRTIKFNADILDSKGIEMAAKYPPVGGIRIDDKAFFTSKIFQDSDNGRRYVVVYGQVDGKISPHLYYKSFSDNFYRLTPWKGGPTQGKGMGIHYTQETKPHPMLAEHFANLEALEQSHSLEQSSLTDFSDEQILELENFFPTQNIFDPDNAVVNEYTAAIGYDRDVRDQDFPEPYASIQMAAPGLAMSERSRANKYLDFVLRDIPKDQRSFAKAFARTQLPPGFEPDFTQPPIHTFTYQGSKTKIVRIESFPAVLNGKPVIWNMASTPEGDVGIEMIYWQDATINRYGTMSKILNSGLLTNKFYEYIRQLNALRPEDKELLTDIDGVYARISKINEKIPALQRYKVALLKRLANGQ